MSNPFPAAPDNTVLKTVYFPRGELATNELVTAPEWAWRVAAPRGASAAAVQSLSARRARIEAFFPRLGAALEKGANWSSRDWTQELNAPRSGRGAISIKEGMPGIPFPSDDSGYGASLIGGSPFPVEMTEAEMVDLLRGCQIRCRQKGLNPRNFDRLHPGWTAACEMGRRIALEAERVFGWSPGVWQALGTDPIEATLKKAPIDSPRPAIR